MIQRGYSPKVESQNILQIQDAVPLLILLIQERVVAGW